MSSLKITFSSINLFYPWNDFDFDTIICNSRKQKFGAIQSCCEYYKFFRQTHTNVIHEGLTLVEIDPIE